MAPSYGRPGSGRTLGENRRCFRGGSPTSPSSRRNDRPGRAGVPRRPDVGLAHARTAPGIPAAAERLVRAVAERKRICVYGDYDADGVTGTSILLTVLRKIGAAAEFYIPNRLEEGYGLNVDALRTLKDSRVSTVVTVDCGITGLAEAEAARKLGLELIVTDHHELANSLPAATVLVHPRLPGSTYPFAGLSGAGVAFKLAWALAQRACGADRVSAEYRDLLLDLVGLAALGLVADVVPLRDENRVFVRHGLKRIAERPSVGLAALCGRGGARQGQAADL